VTRSLSETPSTWVDAGYVIEGEFDPGILTKVTGITPSDILPKPWSLKAHRNPEYKLWIVSTGRVPTDSPQDQIVRLFEIIGPKLPELGNVKARLGLQSRVFLSIYHRHNVQGGGVDFDGSIMELIGKLGPRIDISFSCWFSLTPEGQPDSSGEPRYLSDYRFAP
jgi:hypothetical protein